MEEAVSDGIDVNELEPEAAEGVNADEPDDHDQELPEVILERSSLDGVAQHVQAQMLLGVQILSQREAALSTNFPGHDDQLSLVQPAGEVTYVKWARRSPGSGQRVHLDRFDRVVYPMPLPGNQAQPFRDCFIVHPCVGAAAHRFKGRERDSMPAHMVRLKQMWEVGISGGSLLMSDSCIACGGSRAVLRGCPVCLSTYHPQCFDVLVAESDPERCRIDSPALDVQELQRWRVNGSPLQDGTLCPWCSKYMAIIEEL